jgi:hypothetical protein
MDAYVLGALPPYSQILGGKLVASLIRTVDIQEAFADRYSQTKGIISGRRKHAQLAAITTGSAFGRSAVYNRLRLGEQQIFRSLGFTLGYGHFHIPDSMFALVRAYLKAKRHSYASAFKFGEGPNWRMRAARQAMSLAGMNPRLLKHGVRREIYVSEIASNARDVLLSGTAPNYDELLTATEIGALARERWLAPRAQWDARFRSWQREDFLNLLRPSAGLTQAGLLTETGTDGTR